METGLFLVNLMLCMFLLLFFLVKLTSLEHFCWGKKIRGSAACLSHKFQLEATYKCLMGPEYLSSGYRSRQCRNVMKINVFLF